MAEAGRPFWVPWLEREMKHLQFQVLSFGPELEWSVCMPLCAEVCSIYLLNLKMLQCIGKCID